MGIGGSSSINLFMFRQFHKLKKRRAWDFITQLHEKNMPYNLLYRPGRCYVLPRKMQGDASVVAAVSGAGWVEECGLFVAADKSEIELLSEEIIAENLGSLSVPPSAFENYDC